MISTLGRGASSVVGVLGSEAAAPRLPRPNAAPATWHDTRLWAREAGPGSAPASCCCAALRAGPRSRAQLPRRALTPLPAAPLQVFKGFLVRDARFVALKKINILQKVGAAWAGWRARTWRRRWTPWLGERERRVPRAARRPCTPTCAGDAAADDERRQGAVRRPQRGGAHQFLRRVPRARQRTGARWPEGRKGWGACAPRAPRTVSMPGCPAAGCALGSACSQPASQRAEPAARAPSLQISIVLEYMDGGSLADVLRKVCCGSPRHAALRAPWM